MSRSLFIVLAALVPGTVGAQGEAKRAVFAVHVGVGQHQGVLGGAVEGYVVPGELSLWAGAGYAGCLPAWAAALRWYPSSTPPHRMFVDASWVIVGGGSHGGCTNATSEYAPGVMFGYSYLAGSGFSVSAGLGMAGPTSEGVAPVRQLAAGWTWRKGKRSAGAP